jgi:ATP-dependent helicase/nuclease subunit A
VTAPASFTPMDAPVREEIRTSVAENLLVEAGAGTGKTTSLVGRIVEILASGHATVDELAVITFTHKAAAELSARVREKLEEAASNEKNPNRAEHLAEAARGLYRARVETIHSFATSLLRERPVEAELDPEFRTLTGLEADLNFEEAFEDWLAELFATEIPELATALNLGMGPDELREAADLVHDHRYLMPLEPFEVGGASYAPVTDWLEAHLGEIEAIAARCTNEDSGALPHIERIVRFAQRLEVEGTSEPARARIVARTMPWVSKGAGRKSDWHDAADCPRWKELAGEWRDLLERVPVAMRSAAIAALLPQIEGFVNGYEERRQSQGLADYDDLIIWSRDLVRDRPEVRDYFRKRFRCVLIDEFQDTDPIQVELALYLASDAPDVEEWRSLEPAGGKLFVVGDPKQSIYRFRRADIGIYDQVKAGALAAGLREIVQNFRSVPGVISWVNKAFDRLFERREGLQPANVELGASPFEEPLGRPPVVILRGRDEEANAGKVRESEAVAVAALLDEAIRGDKPWLVRDQVTKEHRPPCWRDVAILLPRRTGLEAYEEALAAADIPYRHEGSRDYFRRDEVRDLIFILGAIDDPRDRISLIGALRSGAFGCSDDDLVIHTGTGGTWSYRAPQDESQSERVVEAFEVLRGLHYARAKLSLPLLVQRVVAESNLVEVALTGRDGPQAAANLLAIVDQARAFSAAGGGSPRAFTRWLAENTERETDEVDAGIAEETDDVVRIMTIHGAKGLEFPIVVMANLGGRGRGNHGPVPREDEHRVHFSVGARGGNTDFPTPGYADRWDEEREALDLEEIRLLYVAATRARDHLIVPDFRGRGKPGSLLEALDEVLPDGDGHMRAVDGVWLLDAEQIEGPAPVEEERRRVKAAEAKRALAERESWSEERSGLIRDAREGLELTVASSVERSLRPLAAEASHTEAAMLVSEGPPLEIGDALHKVMEKVSLPDADDLEMWAEAICAEFGIQQCSDEVIDMARRCLASPSVNRAIESGAYQRELPFTLRGERGYLAGRVDLVFRDHDELRVIDYKTDHVAAEEAAEHAREHYGGQTEAYINAIRSTDPDRRCQVVLFYCRAGIEVTVDASTEAE